VMWEPRGHADMYGCIITPAVSEGADFGVVFTHNEGYSTMCGHGIIAVTTVMLETAETRPADGETTLHIDTPAGLVTATAHVRGGKVERVRFRNVPSFVVELDARVDVPGRGRLRYDLAFGGAFYAYVSADDAGLSLNREDVSRLIDTGMAIKRAVMASRVITHPFEADLSSLYGTILVGRAHTKQAHSRNVCIFAEGEVDRSPTGTGVSGRLAIHHARGEIKLDKRIEIESIIGTRFGGRVLEETHFGPYPAVISEVDGRAWITGQSEFIIHPDDPLKHGFLL
jgi:proline racemase